METKLLWNEAHNVLAVAELDASLCQLTILDEDYTDERKFYSYSLEYLSHFGWHIIGELDEKKGFETKNWIFRAGGAQAISKNAIHRRRNRDV